MFFDRLSNSAVARTLQLPKISAALGWLAQDCLLCGARAGREPVCAQCEAALAPCASCAAPPPIDAAIAAFDYAFPIDRLVQRFKYGGDLAAGRWLATRLAARVEALERPQLLVAPPLSVTSLRARGFNQALEIAKVVGGALGIRVPLHAFDKTRETPPQQTLGRRDRATNLRGAFACRMPLDGEHVAIVDDVVTTGATAAALGESLSRAGAGSVSLWVLARTPE